jgi:hypothetical protein
MVAIHPSFTLQLFPPLAVIVAVAMTRTDRKLLARLRDAQATSPDSALMLDTLSGFAAMRLRRLTDGGAVVATPDGRHFLDEEGWQHYRSERRRRALGAIAVVLFAGAMVLLFAR